MTTSEVTVTTRDGDRVVVFHPLSSGGWVAILDPGWTEFGDTPEEALSRLLDRHPFAMAPPSSAEWLADPPPPAPLWGEAIVGLGSMAIICGLALVGWILVGT